MATSSILGGDSAPEKILGKDTDALGPSDNSDSGSDAQGAYGDDELASDSDAVGTGERATVGTGMDTFNHDILPDHVETMNGADPGGEPVSPPVEELDGVEDLALDDQDESGSEDER